MKIRYLNGIRLKRAIIAGTKTVIQDREYLNKINVFPVADGDTGTNMASTLQSISSALMACMDHTVHGIIRRAADSALLGARGNSGAILAQFIHGLAEELSNKITVTTKSFGQAANNAVDYAYQAISNPREGTILTVIRKWAHVVHERARHTDDFVEVLQASLHSAREALADTPEHLPILKKAGVVDAGAMGFIDMLEGMATFIRHGRIQELEQFTQEKLEEAPTITSEMGDIAFQYCTECIIDGADIDHGILRSRLTDYGDSLIIAGSSTRTKIHIHTNTPREVFRLAESYGELINEKADDMQNQFKSAHTPHGEICLVVDTSCDLPEEVVNRYDIQMVPLRVVFGEKSYVDKLSLTPEDFYQLLREYKDIHPTTSQPTPADFLNKFEFLGQHYQYILTITLSGTLSGTTESARTAARHANIPSEIQVIDSKSLSVAAGLIVRRVAEAMQEGADFEEAASLARQLISRTRILVAVPSLKSLIRGGRVSRMQGVFARLLNLKPVITLNPEGRAVKAATAFGFQGGKQKILQMLAQNLNPDAPTDFAITHVDAPEDAGWFADQITRRFAVDRDLFIQDASPVLAAHAGFGAVAVAYIEPDGQQ